MIRSESNPRRHRTPTTSEQQTAGRSDAESGEDNDPFVDEVANAVAVVFGSVQPTRDDLVTTALRGRAHPTIIAALRALPSRTYRDLQQMRVDLIRQRQH
jgi:hypothetical protein